MPEGTWGPPLEAWEPMLGPGVQGPCHPSSWEEPQSQAAKHRMEARGRGLGTGQAAGS